MGPSWTGVSRGNVTCLVYLCVCVAAAVKEWFLCVVFGLFGLILENGVVLVSALTGIPFHGVEYFGVLLAL